MLVGPQQARERFGSIWVFSVRMRHWNTQFALNRRSFREGWRPLVRVYMVLGEAGTPAMTGAVPKLMIDNSRLESW